jgi:hypothetical protein
MIEDLLLFCIYFIPFTAILAVAAFICEQLEKRNDKSQ